MVINFFRGIPKYDGCCFCIHIHISNNMNIMILLKVLEVELWLGSVDFLL